LPLGLIYVAVRALGAGLASGIIRIMVVWEKDFIAIRKHVGHDVGERETEVPMLEKMLSRVTVTYVFEGITLWLITFICLYELYTAL
jgi:hypothetical protein